MRHPALLLVVLAASACTRSSSPPEAAPRAGAEPPVQATVSPLEARLRARIAREAPGEVAVSLIDVATGRRLGINEHVRMHAASTMKVPVMLELFRQAAAGRFSLDDSVVVKNEFTSIADGSRYSLSPEEDSEQALYRLVGQRATLRDLTQRMITRSSNLATNIVIELVTPDSVRKTMRGLDAEGMRVLRGVEDGPAYERGMNNTTTAAGLARVLEAIARCDGVTGCEALIEILAAQEFNDMIPAGVPAGTRVAHKTGWITAIQHDGAIVYPPGRAPYVLVVLTRGIADTLAAARVAADVSRIVWEELVGGSDAATRRGGDAARKGEGEGVGSAPPALALALAQRYRVEELATREFTHREYWGALAPFFSGSALTREAIGGSGEGRPLYLVRYGRGPTRVLLWSQMHGDESTASMALADLFRFLASSPEHELARRLADRLTLLFIPMLNPDGAERFQRRNAQGIDINRDARALATPEARVLKAARDRYRPDFGFNLHDQNIRTRVGASDRTAAIALLAPPLDAAGRDDEVRRRAKRVAAVVRTAVEPLVPGHVTRYDDTFNPRAFGDLMQKWGTSTVLIESGGWKDDPEKQYLRRVNFVAILTALDAIATGSYATADPAYYESLPRNGRAMNDLLVHGGTVLVPGLPPFRADLAIDFADPLEQRGGRIVEVGDLADGDARETLDASGLYLHPADGAAERGGSPLTIGAPASFVVRRGPSPESAVVWRVENGAARPAGPPAPTRKD